MEWMDEKQRCHERVCQMGCCLYGFFLDVGWFFSSEILKSADKLSLLFRGGVRAHRPSKICPGDLS